VFSLSEGGGMQSRESGGVVSSLGGDGEGNRLHLEAVSLPGERLQPVSKRDAARTADPMMDEVFKSSSV
jgi:hypothetical protein